MLWTNSHLCLKCPKNIRFGGKCGEDNYLLQCVLPGFVLALRDFSLKLIMNGQKVTIDDYLEEILKSDTGKGDAFNKPRKCISKFFPKEKLRCFGFPVPGDGEVLDNLDSLTVQDLSKKFQDVASEFASYIYHQEPKKLQVSKPVNGSMFATLTRQYVEDLANAAVPDVDHAFSAVAKLENKRVQKECLEMFQSRMDRILLPIPAAMLHKEFKEAQLLALKYMRENAVEDVANFVERCSEMEIRLNWQAMQVKNGDAIEEHCSNVLSSLKSRSSLQTGLQNKTYEVIGSYRKFKKDAEMVRQEYEQALRDYEDREIALTWGGFVKSLGQEENLILKKDEALSEEERKRETNAHANSIKQIMQNMHEENQEALNNQKMALNEQQEELNAERKIKYKEHEQQVKTLHENVASFETNKEDQSKIIDHINALQEKKRLGNRKRNSRRSDAAFNGQNRRIGEERKGTKRKVFVYKGLECNL